MLKIFHQNFFFVQSWIVDDKSVHRFEVISNYFSQVICSFNEHFLLAKSLFIKLLFLWFYLLCLFFLNYDGLSCIRLHFLNFWFRLNFFNFWLNLLFNFLFNLFLLFLHWTLELSIVFAHKFFKVAGHFFKVLSAFSELSSALFLVHSSS